MRTIYIILLMLGLEGSVGFTNASGTTDVFPGVTPQIPSTRAHNYHQNTAQVLPALPETTLNGVMA